MKIIKNKDTMNEAKLSDLFDIVGGGTPSTSNEEYWNGNINWISIKELTSKNINSSEKTITSKGLKESSSNLIPSGNIILGTRIGVGEAIIHKKDVAINQDLKGLFLKSKSHNNLYFLYLIKKYSEEFKNKSNGLTVKGIKNNDLKNTVIRYSVCNQEKIAQVLSQQEEQVNNIQKLIEKLEKRNQYYAERLLSGELRVREDEEGNIEFYENEEWKEIKIQNRKFRVPNDYNCIMLKDCEFISLTRGSVLSKKDINKNPGNYPIYSSSVKNNGLMGFYGDFSFNEEMITWSVDGGGNLFYREKHKFNVTNVSGIMRLLNNKNFSLKYIYYLFKEQHKKYTFDYSNKAHPSIIENLYYFTGINKNEQDNIVKILETLDKEKIELEQLLEKEQKRFEWLSEALLSGEYQIVD